MSVFAQMLDQACVTTLVGQELHRRGLKSPVGLLVLVIGLCLGGTTGYAINPARDLSPRLMHFLLPIPNKRDSDWGYAWIPVLGPFVGGALAGGLFLLLAS